MTHKMKAWMNLCNESEEIMSVGDRGSIL